MAEIGTLKKQGPKKRRRRKLLLVDVGNQVVAHFKNARRDPDATHRVYVKVKTWQMVDDPPYVRKSHNVMGVRPEATSVSSNRSLQKERDRQDTKVRIVLERLLRQFPERATEARDNERMANWFVAKCEELIESDIDREQVALLVKTGKLGQIDPKYQHRSARLRDGLERILKEAA